MPHVVIVGGGLSGLATAFRLRSAAPHVAVTVLEPQARAGGNVGTDDRDGFRVERGPNGFLDNKPAMLRLCHDAGLGGRLIPGSEGARTNRYVFVGGKLRKLPRGLLGLLTTPLLSLRGKLALLSEPFRRTPAPAGESVAEFVTRRAGRETADMFADALVTGIHGGDPAQLSVAAAFPRLPPHGARPRQHHPRLHARREAEEARRPAARRAAARAAADVVVPRGAGAAHRHPGRTAGRRREGGVAVRRVRAARRAGWVVRGRRGGTPGRRTRWCWPPRPTRQAEMLEDLDPALAGEIAGIPYNRIAVVAVGYRRGRLPGPLDGFGYIVAAEHPPRPARRAVVLVDLPGPRRPAWCCCAPCAAAATGPRSRTGPTTGWWTRCMRE